MDIQNKGLDPQELADRKYIRYDPGIESIPPNEAEDIQAVADKINAIQKTQWNMHSKFSSSICYVDPDINRARLHWDTCTYSGFSQRQAHCA